MKMLIEDPKTFFQERGEKLHYVGFLKAPQNWLPLCHASCPDSNPHLDTLFLADSYAVMDEVLKFHADRIPAVDKTLIQYLLPEEIANLVDRYALQRIALLVKDDDTIFQCDCGCGCG